jgi:hypothetical protein
MQLIDKLFIRKSHVKEDMRLKVLKEADANIGSAMTYTLIEWVKENLEELLMDQPSNLETSISVSNLDIEEKVNVALSNIINVFIQIILTSFSRLNTCVKTIKNAVLDLRKHRKDDSGIEWMVREKK